MAAQDQVVGYAHPAYAGALGEFGTPRVLPASGGWILETRVADGPLHDARGCYPLFACSNWSCLEDDLDAIQRELVSIVLVTDPFGSYDRELLSRAFPDLCRPYKEHYVVDLTVPVEQRLSRTHSRYVRAASREVVVERCDDPVRHLDEWIGLYACLKARHGIDGISAFSARSFRRQLEVPGIRMYRAVGGGQTTGIVLFYVCGDVGYYHLAAYNDTGYRTRASYALFAYAFADLLPRVRWVCLGAGAGVSGDTDDGLSRFKKGWATATRTAYICGRVFDRANYDQLVGSRPDSGYFPRYRDGEQN